MRKISKEEAVKKGQNAVNEEVANSRSNDGGVSQDKVNDAVQGQNDAVNKESKKKTLDVTESITPTEVPKKKGKQVAKKNAVTGKKVNEPWTDEENRAIKAAFQKNPRITIGEAKKLPELEKRDRDMVSGKLWNLKAEKKKQEEKEPEKEPKERRKREKKPKESALTELNKIISALKEMSESQLSTNTKIFNQLSGIMTELQELKDDVRAMRENR